MIEWLIDWLITTNVINKSNTDAVNFVIVRDADVFIISRIIPKFS